MTFSAAQRSACVCQDRKSRAARAPARGPGLSKHTCSSALTVLPLLPFPSCFWCVPRCSISFDPFMPNSDIINTLAGTGPPGFSGDNGPPSGSQVNGPTGLAMVGQNLLFCDGLNFRIRLVRIGVGHLNTLVGTGVAASLASGRMESAPASVTRVSGCNALTAR